jgi:mannose-binding lectin
MSCLTFLSAPASAGTIQYVEISGNPALTITSTGWTPIPGLSLTLPVATPKAKTALIFLNVPNPYATGSQYPGAKFAIDVDSTMLDPIACFSSATEAPRDTGRLPTTLIATVPLTSSPQTVQAMWLTFRHSKGFIDSPASLSAVIE